MSTTLHLLLALALTSFLAFQAGALVIVLRSRQARAARRSARRSELLWTVIPVVVVLFLAARSWVAVFDLGRPALAGSFVHVERPAPDPSRFQR